MDSSLSYDCEYPVLEALLLPGRRRQDQLMACRLYMLIAMSNQLGYVFTMSSETRSRLRFLEPSLSS